MCVGQWGLRVGERCDTTICHSHGVWGVGESVHRERRGLMVVVAVSLTPVYVHPAPALSKPATLHTTYTCRRPRDRGSGEASERVDGAPDSEVAAAYTLASSLTSTHPHLTCQLTPCPALQVHSSYFPLSPQLPRVLACPLRGL
eukprot:3941611-Rhodomonas_salina.1